MFTRTVAAGKAATKIVGGASCAVGAFIFGTSGMKEWQVLAAGMGAGSFVLIVSGVDDACVAIYGKPKRKTS